LLTIHFPASLGPKTRRLVAHNEKDFLHTTVLKAAQMQGKVSPRRTVDSAVSPWPGSGEYEGDKAARVGKSWRRRDASRKRAIIPLTAPFPLTLARFTRSLLSHLCPLATDGCVASSRSKTNASRTEERAFGDAFFLGSSSRAWTPSSSVEALLGKDP
jgi:hypothetical protein